MLLDSDLYLSMSPHRDLFVCYICVLCGWFDAQIEAYFAWECCGLSEFQTCSVVVVFNPIENSAHFVVCSLWFCTGKQRTQRQ